MTAIDNIDAKTEKESPPTSTYEPLADAQLFIAELEALREADTGRFAALKRNAGETLLGRATAWFFDYLTNPVLPRQLRGQPGSEERRSVGLRQRNAEIYFLVATLYAQFDWKRTRVIDGDFGRTLAELARLMSSERGDEALRKFRRFHILLDAEFDTIRDPLNDDAPWQKGGGEMAYRLRQMVRLLASKGLGANWPQLLVDLSQWSRSDRRIQKKWARSYFGASPPASDSSNTDSQNEQ